MGEFIPDRASKVDGIPPSIRGKMTEFLDATREYAFIGAAYSDDRQAIEDNMQIAWYNLERTIMTELEKVKK